MQSRRLTKAWSGREPAVSLTHSPLGGGWLPPLTLVTCRRKEEPKRRRQALRMSLAFVRSGAMFPRPTRPGRRATVRSGGAPGRSDLIRLGYEAPFAGKPGGWSRPGHAFRAIGAAAARRLIRSVSRIWKVTIISEVGIFGRISGAASWLAEVWERG